MFAIRKFGSGTFWILSGNLHVNNLFVRFPPGFLTSYRQKCESFCNERPAFSYRPITPMTLNVSLIVPDGIVIASDSLMTLTRPITQKMNVDSLCPKCNERVEIKDVQVPPVSVPSTTFPYAQKLFDIKGKFALAVWGSAFVNSRSMYSQVLSMNAKLPDKSEDAAEDYLGVIAEQIKNYFDGQLILECQKTGINLGMQPDSWFPFGFQLAGFSKDANGEPIARVFSI
jgi:hypothetical protein